MIYAIEKRKDMQTDFKKDKQCEISGSHSGFAKGSSVLGYQTMSTCK